MVLPIDSVQGKIFSLLNLSDRWDDFILRFTLIDSYVRYEQACTKWGISALDFQQA